MHARIIKPFFLAEKSVAVQIYLELITKSVAPQLAEYLSSVYFSAERCKTSFEPSSAAMLERNTCRLVDVA